MAGFAICLVLWSTPSSGASFRLDSVGVRGGSSLVDGSSSFNETQGFVNCSLPWLWDLGKEWSVQPRLDFSAGWLGNRSKDAVIGTIGPTLVLRRERLPFSLEAGTGPTLLSRHNFPSSDLGSAVQFSTFVGLNWEFARHWSVGYRFDHISNAGISSPNPGLRMHLFSVSYRF
jgi:lipid A 3-O-deacylase